MAAITRGRVAVVVVIAAAVLVYTVAVISGQVSPTDRIDTPHLTLIVVALIVCAIILRPDVIRHIDQFQALGIGVVVRRLQEQQVAHSEKLNELDMLTPLLFRDPDRKHLINLVRGTTKEYRGGGALREELRRLRSAGLIKSVPDRHIADLHHDTIFDLAHWVALTDVGRYWAARLAALDAAATETSPTAPRATDDN